MKYFLILLAIMALPVYAEDIAELPVVSVTSQPPTKTESRIVEGVQVVEPNPAFNKTFVDSLVTDVEVSNQSTGPQQQSPFIHGFTGYNNVMLIDGIRLNNSIMRSGPNQYWSTLDPFSVGKTSIYYGQSALLYGSDAYGAAINVSTRKRLDFSKEGFNWNGRTAYRFASAEDSNIGRVEFEGNYGKTLGFLVGTSIKDYGDMRGGELTGIQPHTGYDEQDMDARFDWNLTDKSSLTFVHQRYNSNDAWRNHRVVGATANLVIGAQDGTYEYDIYDQGRTLSYMKFTSSEIPWFDEFNTTVSYQETTQFNTFKKANIKPTDKNGQQDQSFDVGTLGVNIGAKNYTKFGNLSYGVDYYHDSVNASGALFNKNGTVNQAGGPPPVSDNSSYDTLGVYVSDDIEIIPKWATLSLTSRYNYVAVKTGNIVDSKNALVASNLDTSWDEFTSGGRLSINLDQNDHYKFFIGANQGWRAPTLVDLSGNSLALSGIFQRPAPAIAPEKFVTYETGIGYQDRDLNMFVTVFRTNLESAINKPASATVLADNSGSGYMQGFAFKSEYSILPELKLFSGFSWTEGYITQYDSDKKSFLKDNISKVNPITGTIGLHYDVSDKLFVETSARFVDSQERLSQNDLTDVTRIPLGGSRGYSLYGIRAGWQPLKNLTISGAIDNLTDADYRVIGSGVNGLGRNYIVSLDYKF
jgi:hemoglobin/transferrin/lactoferrin receptor protein